MVRATFAGFSTALSALQSSQKRLDITGHNLANMNTIGYTRQELQTSSLNYTSPVSTFMNGSEVIVGFGVHMDKVAQIRDPYLDAQYRSQMDKSGYTDSMQTSLDSLSKIFDESTISGIHSAFLDIRGALTEMHDVSKINDPIYESELRSKIQTLTNMLNQASKDIDEAESQEFNRLVGKNTTENGAQEQVNDMLRQIGELNRQIKRNQILGQQSLELMDERNNLLDKLSSFLPIEVTYYKDPAHDGVDANGAPALEENYYLDKNGNIIGKKEWPDDVRVEMVYTDENGDEQRLTLVEGSEGSKGENYGSISFEPADDTKPLSKDNFKLVINGSEKDLVNNNPGGEIEFAKDTTTNPPNTTITNQLGSGSIQSSLDMLWKDGSTANIDDVRGYQFYRDELDKLARSFAYVMNEINIAGTSSDTNVKPLDGTQFLLVNKNNNTLGYDPNNLEDITAANIGINTQWSNGSVHVSMAGKNPTDTVLYMLEAMGATYPNTNKNIENIGRGTGSFDKIGNINLNKNSFADFMNNVSTILANDSYSNSLSLKMNVTVLNGIQNSRDEVSGVSLDEEASNMMQYMSAYNAASRVMTALDQALDVLINSTGMVGR